MTEIAARARQAVKTYGECETTVHALDAVDVEFERGAFTCIMGPSGSGKSTLMHCMAGLDGLTSGQVFIGDTDVSNLDELGRTLLRRDRMGFIFQAFNLVPNLSARENISLPRRLANSTPDPEWFDLVVEKVGPRPARPGNVPPPHVACAGARAVTELGPRRTLVRCRRDDSTPES